MTDRRAFLETAAAATLLWSAPPVGAQEKGKVLIVSTSHADTPGCRN